MKPHRYKDNIPLSNQYARAVKRVKNISDNKIKQVNKLFDWFHSHYLHHDADVGIYKYRGKKWFVTNYDTYTCKITLQSQFSKETAKIQF